jgi:hypothetical protein
VNCPFCNNEIPAEARYCTRCGKPVHTHPIGMELILQGREGKTLLVSGDVVRIEKQGGLFATKREKTITIRNITSVEVKKPGAWAGFIQFSIAGGLARDSSYTFTGGSFDAVRDENSVVFATPEQYVTALEIKAYIEEWQAKAARLSTAPASQPSVADEIRKLKALVDEGILNNDEFEKKKKQLLGF